MMLRVRFREILILFSFISGIHASPLPAAPPGAGSSHEDVTGRLIEAALSDYEGHRLLEELCALGPRLSGSENSLNAIRWAREKMEAMGFDRVWLQPVMVPRWERGGTEDFGLVSGEHAGKKLRIGALGGSVPTPEGGITAGVLEVRSFEELRLKGDEARGKIVFFNHPMDAGNPDTFEAYGDAVRYRARGASEAAKAGGLAAIVRSVTTRHDDNPHVGMMTYEEGVNRIPTAAVSIAGAEFLSAALKKDRALNARLELSCRTLPDAESFNLIGEITGTEFPEEVIVVGGHFDSWDVGDGAHDCGGGCIQSLEVLRLFKRLSISPKRTVRCVFFINEENGLRGATAYAKYAEEAAETHCAAIESDRGLFTPRGFYADTDSSAVATMRTWLPLLRRAGIEWVDPGGGGPDVNAIKAARARIDYVPDCQRYFDVHHSANDVFEAVHPREMELGTAALAILVYMLSEEGL